MIGTLMRGLNEKGMKAVVNDFKLNDYYFPTLFPIKETKTLTWKTLSVRTGLHIAADLIARGARLTPKTREALERIEGEFPKIGIERAMTEEEMEEYNNAVQNASTEQDLINLVETWANDLEYCWNGVAARIEWTALYEMSHAGKVKVTSENNAHVVTENTVDYEIPSDQKVGTAISWKTNAATAKPFSVDIRNILKASRHNSKGGIRLKHAWLNQETFNYLVETTECQKLCASYVANALGLQTVPDLAAVNAMAAKVPYLYGLQFHVIDQSITVEFMDGSRTTGNPFADNVVLFTEDAVLGNTFWKRPVGMDIQGTAAIKTMREYCMLKKFGNEDPETEVTQGIANAFPAWAGSERTYHLDTHNATWQEGAENG